MTGIAIYLLLGGIVNLLGYLLARRLFEQEKKPIRPITWVVVVLIWPVIVLATLSNRFTQMK